MVQLGNWNPTGKLCFLTTCHPSFMVHRWVLASFTLAPLCCKFLYIPIYAFQLVAVVAASKQAAELQASRRQAGKVVLSKLLSDHLSLSLSISGQLPAALRGYLLSSSPRATTGFQLKTYDHTNKVTTHDHTKLITLIIISPHLFFFS